MKYRVERLIIGVVACAALMLPLAAHTEPLTPEELKAGTKNYEYTRFTAPGKKLMVSDLVFMSPNCSLQDSDITVTKDAEHGMAAIEIVERNVAYGVDSPYRKCNEKGKFSIPTVSYKAAVGYSGTDSFEVTVINPEGFKFVYRYTMTIVDRNAKKGRVDIRP